MKFTLPFLLLAIHLQAGNIKISEPILYSENGSSYTLLNISWENAWHNEKNHDAAWVFFKFLNGTNGYTHVQLMENGHSVSALHTEKKMELNFEVPADRTGVFISPKSNYRGAINATVKIMLDPESFKRVNKRRANFSAYAIEMAHVPAGGFWAGDLDTLSVQFGGLYMSNGNGEHGGPFSISAENQEINIGPEKGQLYYQAKRQEYQGDQKGTIPADFPKGVEAFYIMKYEPTQGQYAGFLNSLSDYQSQNRANFGGKNYYAQRGSIKINDGKYMAEVPDAPCNYMSWDDAMAFADWAGLRPMTELEFTKAARGTKKPTVGNDFPWGNNSKENMQRMVADNGELKMLNHWDESNLSENNKAQYGASYYWVMDLSGSLWERVITIGDEKGRNFTGTHGDGQLSYYGFATNEDWPKGIEETGGFGFRGGGFYGYGRDYHEFNPYSPVSFRTYGAWSGGNRTEAYGARFVKNDE